jgi:hypothetical protein
MVAARHFVFWNSDDAGYPPPSLTSSAVDAGRHHRTCSGIPSVEFQADVQVHNSATQQLSLSPRSRDSHSDSAQAAGSQAETPNSTENH